MNFIQSDAHMSIAEKSSSWRLISCDIMHKHMELQFDQILHVQSWRHARHSIFKRPLRQSSHVNCVGVWSSRRKQHVNPHTRLVWRQWRMNVSTTWFISSCYFIFLSIFFSCNSNCKIWRDGLEDVPQVQEKGSRKCDTDCKSFRKSGDNRLWMAKIDTARSNAKARKSGISKTTERTRWKSPLWARSK